MTDKQIIIDVTQCPYYKEDKICTYLPYKTKCEGDCNWTSYKEMEEQLKRKEQECEELKYELVLKDVANIELSDEVKKYSKAIDEIEEIADNNYEIAEMRQIFLIIGGLDV